VVSRCADLFMGSRSHTQQHQLQQLYCTGSHTARRPYRQHYTVASCCFLCCRVLREYHSGLQPSWCAAAGRPAQSSSCCLVVGRAANARAGPPALQQLMWGFPGEITARNSKQQPFLSWRTFRWFACLVSCRQYALAQEVVALWQWQPHASTQLLPTKHGACSQLDKLGPPPAYHGCAAAQERTQCWLSCLVWSIQQYSLPASNVSS
jgi:hypothetical protein